MIVENIPDIRELDGGGLAVKVVKLVICVSPVSPIFHIVSTVNS